MNVALCIKLDLNITYCVCYERWNESYELLMLLPLQLKINVNFVLPVQ
jgi:hypothetical protein